MYVYIYIYICIWAQWQICPGVGGWAPAAGRLVAAMPQDEAMIMIIRIIILYYHYYYYYHYYDYYHYYYCYYLYDDINNANIGGRQFREPPLGHAGFVSY